MKRHSLPLVIGLVAIPMLFTACNQSLVISKVDYSQPVETVLEPNDQGMVKDVRNGLTFNIKPLQYAETQDTSSVTTREVRFIRGMEGYYYITAPGYKHVYVMAPKKGKLALKKKFKVSDRGIAEPAFNQRDPYVQLLNRETNTTYRLTASGMKEQSSPQLSSNKEGETNESL